MPVFKFDEVEIAFVKVKEGAKEPTYATDGSCACDFYACFGHSGIHILPGKKAEVPLGIAIELPPGVKMEWKDRSGLSGKHDIIHRAGYFDCDFRGELTVVLKNDGKMPYPIHEGDRVIQGEIAPVLHGKFVKVDKLSETERGTGGFGSTGK